MNTLKLEGERKNIRVNAIAPVAATRMTADLGMPEEVFKALKPELVTPAVLYLCSEDAPNGTIIEAGAGYFAKVTVMEGKGVHLGARPSGEAVAAAFARIAAPHEAPPFWRGAEVTQKIFASKARWARGRRPSLRREAHGHVLDAVQEVRAQALDRTRQLDVG